MRLERLLAITVLLTNRKRISSKELAEHFEVSVRTIYRDIEAIEQAGIPIISYQGSNGGFGIIENYKIDRQILTFDDMLSIMTALKGVNNTLADNQFTNTLEKIKGLIPKNDWDTIMKRNNQIIIDFSPWGFTRNQKEKLNTIRKAISESRLLDFYYTNTKGESKQRQIEPMSISYKGNSWYLYGYCRIRNDFRLFRISRMKNIKLTDEQFPPKEGILEEYHLEETRGNEVQKIDLVLRFKPFVRVRVEDSFDDESIQILEDGSLLVKVTFPEDEWVYGMVLSYGDNVKVIEPQYLRDIIKERGKRIWELYK